MKQKNVKGILIMTRLSFDDLTIKIEEENNEIANKAETYTGFYYLYDTEHNLYKWTFNINDMDKAFRLISFLYVFHMGDNNEK